MLEIRLFGELDLRLDGEPLPALESGRARSLLGWLVLHRGVPQSRQRLAFLLWPDSAEGQARTNLRHLVHTLRAAAPALERFLDVTPQTVRWRDEVPCRIDVADFEAAMADTDVAGDVLPALRAAVGLYAGDLLEGSYDEWLVEDRERLRDRYTTALGRASGLLAARGEHGEAVRLGRELLRCDPLQEATYRLLMGLHAAAGDRAAAVRVYHECVSTLQRELDVPPSEATTEAYAALLRAPATAQEPAAVGRSVLVGRGGEWERLTDHWRDAEQGRAQLVLVTGEPGIGKTRLAEDLAAWCAHRGALVAQARSYAGEGELGHGVVIAWLRSVDMATHVRRASPGDLAELSRLLPELAGGGDAAAPEMADHAERRRRLFDAVGRALVASGRPTLLVADDAQWCDEQSLQLVHYLVRLHAGHPLLVVGTARREDLEEAHPLRALAAGLQVADRCSEIGLGRLGRAGTAELAGRLAGRALDAGAIDGLYGDTEGNPLFIVEMLRARADDAGAGPPELTPKLQAVIGARLRQLTGPARALLGMAATVGRAFTSPVLEHAAGLDDSALVGGLDELWRRGVIREQGTDAYDFAHGRIRDVAYDSLSPAERRRNHAVIAEALVRLHPGDLDVVSGEVARHYDRSGRVDEALSWYRRAAVQAQRLDANHEAVRLLDRARALVVGLPEGAGRRRQELDVLAPLPTPLALAEGFASSRLAATQQRLLDLAGEVGVEPDSSLLRSIAMSSLCRDDFDGARAVAGRLRGPAERDGDQVLLVETEYLLGIGAFWGGALETARRHFERVGERFDAGRRAEHLLRFGHDAGTVSLSRLANTLWFLGATDDARRARDAAMATAVEVGHLFSRGVAGLFAALLSVDMGEPTGFRDYVAALGDQGDDQPLQVAREAFLGYVDVLDGRTEAGIARIQTVVDTNHVNHAPGQLAAHRRLLLAAHDAAGDATGGLAAADEALRSGGTRLWEGEVRRLRAGFLARLGAPWAEVDAELARAAGVARRQGAAGVERRVDATRSDLRPEG